MRCKVGIALHQSIYSNTHLTTHETLPLRVEVKCRENCRILKTPTSKGRGRPKDPFREKCRCRGREN